jgi:hypothetical protein
VTNNAGSGLDEWALLMQSVLAAGEMSSPQVAEQWKSFLHRYSGTQALCHNILNVSVLYKR